MKRIEILKTYKIYIGGKFPRTESGRYYKVSNTSGDLLANACQCSRKDVREAVVAARKAFSDWSGKSAFNRGQILYRIAEMLESRKAQFVEELLKQGASKKQVDEEVAAAIDNLVYYSGWCDKYTQVFSSVNPVATSHFNFSVPEPMGVIGIFAPENNPLLGLVSALAPAIAGSNTCIIIASEKKPLCAVSFAEVLHSSDVPGGVVNILTGFRKELLEPLASHFDVNAITCFGMAKTDMKTIQELAAQNVKRVFAYTENSAESPYSILDLQEVKTTWHPIENIGSAGGGY